MPTKRHLPISKLVSKLRKRPSLMMLFHQKKESQLQQSQLPKRPSLLSQRPRSQSKKLVHQQKLLQSQLQRNHLKDQFKIKYSKHKNNRYKLKQLLIKRNKINKSQPPLLRLRSLLQLQLLKLLSQL